MLAYIGFPAEHWSKLHSTNGLQRLNAAKNVLALAVNGVASIVFGAVTSSSI